jgi:hypothetical protein
MSQGNTRTGGERRKFPEWRPPDAAENNRRVIYGIPHTWDGCKSWMKDQTPASDLPDTPPGALNKGEGKW